MKRFGTAWTVFCLFSLSFFIIATASTCLSAEEQAASQAGQEQAESVRDDTETSETAEADTEETEPDTAGQKLETKEIGEETAGIKTMTVSAPEEDTVSQSIEVTTAETITPVGVLSYRIPVKVPRGRMGIEPDIAFVYKSYLKNGWLGVGWDLDMGSIRRSVKRGLDYGGDDFVYVKDGVKTELADRSNEWGSGYYGAKIEDEEGFSRFKFDQVNNTWIRTTKDGTKYYYGQSSNSRQESVYGVFGWHLDRIEDTNRNEVTVTYVKDQGRIYLSEITYPGGGDDKHIAFILEERDDFNVSFTTHNEVKTARRLNRVETYTGTQLIRTYRLTYGRGTAGVHSRLTGIQEWAPEGPSEIALPPYTFTCQEGGDGTFTSHDAYAILNYGGQIIHVPLEFDPHDYVYTAEFNGDGRADILQFNQANYPSGFLSNGDGTFESASMGLFNPPDSDFYKFKFVGDVNGDVLSDLTYFYYRDCGHEHRQCYELRVRVCLSNGHGFSNSVQSLLGMFSCGKGYPLLIDANGDGYSDLFLIGTYYNRNSVLCLSNGDGTFSRGSSVSTPSEIGYNSTLYVGDVNGDDLPDIIRQVGDNEWPGPISVYLSRGGGKLSSAIPANFSGQDIRMIDANGDGYADILTKNIFPPTRTIYLSNGDGTFQTSPYGELPHNSTQKLLTADFNGDGVTDSLTNTATGGGCPDLLTKIENPYGATATIDYTPSTQYDNTALPFPLYVVSSLEIDPGVGVRSTTTYDYQGGLFDPDDRAFWGFEKVTKTNPDGTVEEITYHQDLYRRGRPLQVTITEPGGISPFSVTANTWETSPASPAQDGWAFVKRTRERTDLYDDQQVYMQSDYTYDGDNGNLLSIERSGTSGPQVTEEMEYVNKLAARDGWLWRTVKESLKNDQGTTIREVSCTYDDNGNKLTETRCLDGVNDPVITMTCDTWGNMLTEQDALGNVTTMEYDMDTHSYLSRITYPQTGAVAHIVDYPAYDDRFGRLTLKIDENGNETNYSYDPFGRLEQIDYPDGGQKLREFHDDAVPRYVITRVLESDNPVSYVNGYEYLDGLGRTVQTVAFGEDATPVVTRLSYDEMGREDRIDGPFFASGSTYPQTPPASFHYRETSYDYRSRPAEVIEPDGSYGTVSTTCGYSGLSTTVTDPDGYMKTRTSDYLNRIIEVVEHIGAGLTTAYTYNEAGDLLTILDSMGNTTVFTYDLLGRKTTMDDQDMGHWTYVYDRNDNLTTQTDNRGQVITMTYDQLNRIMSKTYSTYDPAVSYVYDSAVNGKPYLSRVSNGQVVTDYTSYDPMGRIASVTKTITGTAPCTTSYTYDLSGKTKIVTFPDSEQIHYTYYPGSDLIETVLRGETECSSFSGYQPAGKIGLIDYGNDTTTSYTYDPQSTRLTDIVTHDINNIPLQMRTYTYTRAGDIQSIADAVNNVTYTYTYDELHRLAGETNTGGYDSLSFTYNPTGNIMSKTIGRTTLTYAYDDRNHRHAVTSITVNGIPHAFTYDDNGNMQSGPDLTDMNSIADRSSITYNADNMPNTIVHSTGGTVNLIYGGEVTRAKKTTTGSTTYYIGEHYEITDTGNTKYIFAGNLRLAKISQEGIFYFHKDHLNSSTVVSNETGIGSVETTEYMPFGSMRDHSGISASNYKFTDQEFDPETGLYNYKARLYDPSIGRFITPDSIIPDPYDPQSLNRYSYCRNNPLIYVDPSGHEESDSGISGLDSSKSGEGGGGDEGKDPATNISPNNKISTYGDSDDDERKGILTGEQVGNIVFNETRSLYGKGINDAREAIAHSIINADESYGEERSVYAKTAPTSANVPQAERGTYEACQKAAGKAADEHARGEDTTKGATNFNMRNDPSKEPFWGMPVKTQHGPFNNSYTMGTLNPKGVYVNTYGRQR